MMKFILSFLLLICFCSNCSLSKISTENLQKQKEIYGSSLHYVVKGRQNLPLDKSLSNISEKDVNKEGYVPMLSWKSKKAAFNYYNTPGMLDTLDSPYLTWVTKKSEFLAKAKSNKLQRFKGQKLALRLEQLLGLPPQADTSRYFLEIWVKSQDLFRPCRDPEISDFACDKIFPLGAFSNTNAGYQKVYQEIEKSTEDFPWTSLGYTYDWNKKSRDHFGLSEYIIRQNAVVRIKNKLRTEDFFK